MMQMLHPGWLWLFLLYIPLIAWYVYSHRTAHPTMRMSTTEAFDRLPASWRGGLNHLVFALRLLALGCLIIILCRPQTHDSWSTSDVEGTDIIVAMDVSTSMLAKDFSPNRMESAKKVATQFVAGREHDNIGLELTPAGARSMSRIRCYFSPNYRTSSTAVMRRCPRAATPHRCSRMVSTALPRRWAKSRWRPSSKLPTARTRS